MSHLITVNTCPDTVPVAAKPAADRLISGDPSFLTWALDTSREEASEGKVRTGIWRATPGETISIKGSTFEFCHILEGHVEIEENGQAPVAYRAGDSFIMKPGFEGIWRTIETVRKIYVIVG